MTNADMLSDMLKKVKDAEQAVDLINIQFLSIKSLLQRMQDAGMFDEMDGAEHGR